MSITKLLFCWPRSALRRNTLFFPLTALLSAPLPGNGARTALGPMELRQLRYFVAIVDHGSLSRAALILHVAQPALTQQLRQLEEELGVQLLHRSAQGVLSTDAGKVFYEHAQAILKQVADARSAVTQSATRPSGNVTLGLPHSISGALALPLLLAARERYPEITLQLTEEITGNLNEQLKSGRINLAVLFDDGQLTPFACSPLVEVLHLLRGHPAGLGPTDRAVGKAPGVDRDQRCGQDWQPPRLGAPPWRPHQRQAQGCPQRGKIKKSFSGVVERQINHRAQEQE